MTEPTLARGHNNSHEWVGYAQKMINHARSGGVHLPMDENGVFDEAMEKEVLGFQESHGLPQTGKVDHHTWAAIHAAVKTEQHAAAGQSGHDLEMSPAPHRDQGQLEHDSRKTDKEKNEERFHERSDGQGHSVRVYDMDGEDYVVAEGEHKMWGAAVTDIYTLALANISYQLPYVHVAVANFVKESQGKIADFTAAAHQFEHDSHDIHLEIPWGLLVDGLEAGLAAIYKPEEKLGKFLHELAKKEFAHGLDHLMKAAADPVEALDKKLEAGIAELSSEVNNRTAKAISEVTTGLLDHVKDAMHDYTLVSLQPDWISEMATYLGVPLLQEDDVTAPITSWLDYQFDALLQQVEREFLALH